MNLPTPNKTTLINVRTPLDVRNILSGYHYRLRFGWPIADIVRFTNSFTYLLTFTYLFTTPASRNDDYCCRGWLFLTGSGRTLQLLREIEFLGQIMNFSEGRWLQKKCQKHDNLTTSSTLYIICVPLTE